MGPRVREEDDGDTATLTKPIWSIKFLFGYSSPGVGVTVLGNFPTIPMSTFDRRNAATGTENFLFGSDDCLPHPCSAVEDYSGTRRNPTQYQCDSCFSPAGRLYFACSFRQTVTMPQKEAPPLDRSLSPPIQSPPLRGCKR